MFHISPYITLPLTALSQHSISNTFQLELLLSWIPCLCLCRPSRDTPISLSTLHSLAQIETSERREGLAYFAKLATPWTEVCRSLSFTLITAQFTFIFRSLPKFHKLAGRSGDRIPVGARIFAPFPTGSGVDPPSYIIGTDFYPGVRPALGVDHRTHILQMLKKPFGNVFATHFSPCMFLA